jgi:phosphoribosylformylglycinamidine (FGAM) synthase-like enzyme
MAGRGGLGIELDLDRVPLREAGLTPYEILLSESQERMLLVAERGREAELTAVFEKWDLHAVVVGRITGDSRWRATYRGKVVADIPVKALSDEAPVYDRPAHTSEAEGGASKGVRDVRTAPEGRDSRLRAELRNLRRAHSERSERLCEGCPVRLRSGQAPRLEPWAAVEARLAVILLFGFVVTKG